MDQAYQPSQAPVWQMKTNRGLFKCIFLSAITFGIYRIVLFSSISTDINIIAGRYDGKKTMHYCLLYFLIGWLTAGLAFPFWYHRISERIGYELIRRGIYYPFDASTYWLWRVLGAIIIVGPFVYGYKLFKAMNLLSLHYNTHG